MSLVGIIGDTHFGSSFSLGYTDPTTQLNSRLLDFVNTYNKIIDEFKRDNVEIVVISGDVFDVKNPSAPVIAAFTKCLKRTLDFGFEVVIISGNHDQQRTISTTTIDMFDHLTLDRLSIFTDIGVKSFKDFHLVLIPYTDRKKLQAESNEQGASLIKDKIDAATKNLNGVKLVVGHLMLEGTSGINDANAFSANELILPLNTFEGLNAVIMGHIHAPQIIREDPLAMYIGSMEKLNFGDKNCDKQTIIINTDKLPKFKKLTTSCKNIVELSFDFSDKTYKTDITDKILGSIDKYVSKHDIKGCITRIVVKMKDLDVYHVNQDLIKKKMLGFEVESLTDIHISSMSSRQLRDETITEGQDSKKAFKTYIENLSENDALKKKILKAGEKIINDIEGK